MDAIVNALGLNSTVYFQMILFSITFLVLNFLIFKPYLRAAEERESRTFGNEDAAQSLLDEARKLNEEYEKEAKELNAKLKTFFDDARTEAKKQYDEIVSSARSDADKTLSSSRAELAQQVEKARSEMKNQVGQVGEEMAAKILGKV